MNRKIKFSLNFNNKSVRTVEEFKEHFDLKEAVECFNDSRLTRWLDVHGYTDYYNKVKEIKSLIDIDISKNIVEIFSLNIDNLIIENTFKIKDVNKDELIETQILLSESKYDYRINTAFHKNINEIIKIPYFNIDLIKNTVNELYSIYLSEINIINNEILLNSFQYISENSPILAYEVLKNEEFNKILNLEKKLEEITNDLLNYTMERCKNDYTFRDFICNNYFCFYDSQLSNKILFIRGSNITFKSCNEKKLKELLSFSNISIKMDKDSFKNKIIMLFSSQWYLTLDNIRNRYNIFYHDKKSNISVTDNWIHLNDIINNKISGIVFLKI